MSCAEGDTGFAYDGELDFEVEHVASDAMPKLPLAVMMNVGNRDRAFHFASLPNEGVGLARVEFIINNGHRGAPSRSARKLEEILDDLKAAVLETGSTATPIAGRFGFDKLIRRYRVWLRCGASTRFGGAVIRRCGGSQIPLV